MRYIVGVMGPAKARKKDVDNARVLGELIARREWVVLTGGRDVGVMDAACQGAKKVPGSLTIGVLPSARERVSKYVDLAIITEMGNARNNVNVMSSNVVHVQQCGGGVRADGGRHRVGGGARAQGGKAGDSGRSHAGRGEIFQETR